MIATLRRDLARVKQQVEDAARIDEHEAETYLALLQGHDRDVVQGALSGDSGRHANNGKHQNTSTEELSSPSRRLMVGQSFLAPASPPLPCDEHRPSAPHPNRSHAHESRTDSRTHSERFFPPSAPAQVMQASESLGHPLRNESLPPARSQRLSDSAGSTSQQPLSQRWSRLIDGLHLARSPSPVD